MKRSRMSRGFHGAGVTRRGRILKILSVPYSEAAMYSKISGRTVFARKRGRSVYEVRVPQSKTWWGAFTAGELGISD